MKKKIILTAFILLVSSYAFAADQANDESTQLQFQKESMVQYQARVDPDAIPAVLQVMQRNQFRNENTVHIRNMIKDAQRQGLPVAPMTDKVYEGVAKKVNEDAIVQAVKRVQNRYEHAYRQATRLTTDKQQARQLGQIIAEAYTAGMKVEDCAQIMTQLQTRTRATSRQETKELMLQTMVTARIMARRGVESTTIGDVLEKALQHSYQASEMHTLQNSFVEKSRYGSPENVARGFSADVSQGKNASELGAQSSESGSRGGSSGGSGGSSGGSGGSSGGSGGSSGGSGSSSGGSGGSSGGSGGSSGGSGGSSGGSGGSSGGSGGSSGGSGGSSGR